MEVEKLLEFRRQLQDNLGVFIANEVSRFVEGTGIGVSDIEVEFNYVKYLGRTDVTLNDCKVKVRLDL